jgi:hypothetical protein
MKLPDRYRCGHYRVLLTPLNGWATFTVDPMDNSSSSTGTYIGFFEFDGSDFYPDLSQGIHPHQLLPLREFIRVRIFIQERAAASGIIPIINN